MRLFLNPVLHPVRGGYAPPGVMFSTILYNATQSPGRVVREAADLEAIARAVDTAIAATAVFRGVADAIASASVVVGR